jgi:DNA repair exonuclease SbcCD ATPase subunit
MFGLFALPDRVAKIEQRIKSMASAIEQILQAASEEKAQVNVRLSELEGKVEALTEQVAQGLEGLEVVNQLESIKASIQGIYVPVDAAPVESEPTDEVPPADETLEPGVEV